MKENNENKIKKEDEISKLIKAFPKDIAALDKRSVLAKVNQTLADDEPLIKRFLPDKSSMISCGWKTSPNCSSHVSLGSAINWFSDT